MKNRFIKFFIIFIIFVAIAGCGKKRQNKNQMFSTTKSVKDTIEEEMKKEEEKKENAEKENAENEKALKNDFQATEEDVKEINEDKNEENKKAENVGGENQKDIDYDLTEMNSDMIYATVFMVVQDPESYAGKTFKIYGNSYTFPTTEGKSMTHYCLIKDALACCAQGLEFISSNSDEKYPDDGDEIVVTGTLESYTVEDIPMPLCRLVNAKIEKKTNEK